MTGQGDNLTLSPARHMRIGCLVEPEAGKQRIFKAKREAVRTPVTGSANCDAVASEIEVHGSIEQDVHKSPSQPSLTNGKPPTDVRSIPNSRNFGAKFKHVAGELGASYSLRATAPDRKAPPVLGSCSYFVPPSSASTLAGGGA